MRSASNMIGMIIETMPHLHSLSPEEKMVLASELWDEAAGEFGKSDAEMVDAVRALYHDYQAHPDQVVSWTDLRARVRERNRKGDGEGA